MISLSWIAMEALDRFQWRTGESRIITVHDVKDLLTWNRVEDPRYPDAPRLELDWPYGLKLTVDEASPLIDTLLDRHDPVAWESSIEARLQRGALAYQCASEKFALDLYRRVHL